MPDQTENCPITLTITTPPAKISDGDIWIDAANGCFNVAWNGSRFSARKASNAIQAAVEHAMSHLRDRLVKVTKERDEALAIDEIWREGANRTLDEERARSQRYREKQGEAERQRDDARAQARKIGEECRALQTRIDEQSRAIEALHKALADALGIPA